MRVDYATSGGTTHVGSDYRTASGTLTFRPVETATTISVPVLGDSHHEDYERMTLTLSNPHPWWREHLHDATAMGTIGNADPMPRAWIGRFGRSVADQVLDAVDDRMRAEPAPGVEAHVTGQGDRRRPGVRSRPARGSDVRCGRSWAADEQARAAARHVVLADRGDRRRGPHLGLGGGRSRCTARRPITLRACLRPHFDPLSRL